MYERVHGQAARADCSVVAQLMCAGAQSAVVLDRAGDVLVGGWPG
jgi:hypothetical protein